MLYQHSLRAVVRGHTDYLPGLGVMLLLGVAIATLPVSWLIVAIPSILIAVLVWIRPVWALYLIAFAIPFGSLYEIHLGGIGVGATEALLALLLAAWAARLLAFRERVQVPDLSWPLAAFVWIGLFSLLNAAALPSALKEMAKWVEFLGVLLFVSNGITDRERTGVIACLLVAGVSQSLLGAYQFLTQSGPDFFRLMGRFMRAYGTFEQPNPYAGYLGLTAPLGLALGLTLFGTRGAARFPRWLGWLGAASFALLAVAMGMSWSRGGWLAFIGASAAVVVAMSHKRAVLIPAMVGVFALLGLTGTFELLPASVSQRLTSYLPFVGLQDVRSVEVTDENYAAVERLAHWQAALEMWRDHPWLGVGLGNYEAVYGAYALPKWPLALGHAHNYYLNIAAETGLIGLVAYLVLWGTAAWQVVRRVAESNGLLQRALAAAALGILAHVSVHNTVDNLWVHSLYIQVAIILGLVEMSYLQRSEFA